MAKRIGPKMAMVQCFVEANPGLPMMRAASHASPLSNPYRNWALGYNPVHRALRAGLVVGRRGPRGSTLLFPVGARS